MSRFVEKTFETLNSVLNNSGLFNPSQDKSFHKFQFHWAVDSNAFLSNLKNAETKQEEENIITTCLAAMKKRLSDAEVSNAEVENMVKMCLICETMGYSAPFIYVHSIKLAQKGNLQEKHTGYLATSFFLHPHHELVILLINTMQKDLCSSNYMEVLFALTCVCNLINSETVHNVLHLVQDRLNHEKADVRKLAVLALGHCLQLAGSQSADLMAFPKLEKALSDSELEVVAAAVQTIFKVVQRLPSDFTYLINSLVDLQDQILLRRIPRSMNYCDIPAPWLQIDIIKMLSFLCKKPEHCQKLTSVLKKTLLQTVQHNSMCHAIMYEVIQALTHMETNAELTELVLSSVSTFLKSKNVNLKLIGIEALISVVKRIKPSITSVQQEIIMECLKLPDETLQLKTLELIYQLANPSNVIAICKKMMEFIISSVDNEKKKDLSIKILQLAEKFKDENEWYISVIIDVLLNAGDVLPTSNMHDVINKISKDCILKSLAKQTCLKLYKEKQCLPPSLIKVIASVLITSSEFEEVLPSLLKTADDASASWLLVSLLEVILKTKKISSDFVNMLRNMEVKPEGASQVLNQLLNVIDCLPELKDYEETEEIDPSLTFLDNFVIEALEKSSSCYQPLSYRFTSLPNEQSAPDFQTKSDSFSADCSEMSLAQNSGTTPSRLSPMYSVFSSPSTSFQSLPGEKDISVTLPKAKVVWTSEGRGKTRSKGDSPSESDKKCDQDDKDEDLLELFAGVS